MRSHPLFSLAPLFGLALAACAQPDPFAADKPKGPVKPARYEPVRGAYLGAALDVTQTRGDVVTSLASQMRQHNSLTGKNQALQMHFLQFPNPAGEFGTWEQDSNGWISAQKFSQAASLAGAAPILSLEPFAPQLFLDWRPGSKSFEATKAFAQKVGAFKKPVFIRFAHEMNGSWYPWGEWIDQNRNLRRDPGEDTGFTAEHYRKVFRNFALMFRQHAPNAAMVWCPNAGLLGGEKRDVFRPFYPGDDVVDWVGLDIYERGWNLPKPGARLWGGQFARNLRYDMTDDPKTEANESVNFYTVYCEWKKKPLMLCETSSTLSFRTDLPANQRARINFEWKAGYWNSSEYGWLQGVYGTTKYPAKLLHPIDRDFPMIKAIVWFQIAKREYVVCESPPGNYVWFNNEWTDYRIGGGVEENVPGSYAAQELNVFRNLTANNPYFLGRIQTR